MKIKQINKLTDKINFGKPYLTPICNNPDLPKIYNIMLVAGSKGSGKGIITNQYLQLVEKAGYKMPNGDPVQQRIIWVSGGTSKSNQNSILDELKYLSDEDRIDLGDNPNEELKEIYEGIKFERDTIESYNVYREVYAKFKKIKNVGDLSDDELMLLKFKSFVDPKDDPEAPKDEYGNILYHPRVVHFVLDDLIGSDVFSNNKRGNWCNSISIKSRHDSKDLCPINLIYLTQNFKSISPIIRKQTDYFILLKNANRVAIIEAISTEIGTFFSRDEIEQAYNEIMKIPYGSLIISIHKSELPENRLRVGWSGRIIRDDKYVFDK